jgi:hypothetical protein
MELTGIERTLFDEQRESGAKGRLTFGGADEHFCVVDQGEEQRDVVIDHPAQRVGGSAMVGISTIERGYHDIRVEYARRHARSWLRSRCRVVALAHVAADPAAPIRQRY